jgi:hypothetical protein
MNRERGNVRETLCRTPAFPRLSGRREITILKFGSRRFKDLANLPGKTVRNGLNGIAITEKTGRFPGGTIPGPAQIALEAVLKGSV